MGRHYQILLPLFSIFLVRVDLTDLFPLKTTVQVVKIYDGDTVLVRRGLTDIKVRFSKIDSPEKGQRFFHSQIDAGMVSKKCLQKLLKKEMVLKAEHKDMYGRVLGDLDDLSYKLIQNGCTTIYPYARFANEVEKFKYLHALKKAKALKLGLWKYGGFLQPKMYRKLSKRGAVRR